MPLYDFCKGYAEKKTMGEKAVTMVLSRAFETKLNQAVLQGHTVARVLYEKFITVIN